MCRSPQAAYRAVLGASCFSAYDVWCASACRSQCRRVTTESCAMLPPSPTIVDPADDTVPAPDSGLWVRWASGSSPWAFVFLTRGNAPDVFFSPALVRRDTSYFVRGFYFASDSIIIVSVMAVDS